jgi:hypothetical protein
MQTAQANIQKPKNTTEDNSEKLFTAGANRLSLQAPLARGACYWDYAKLKRERYV